MYHVSPYSYLIEGLLGAAIGNMEINCAPVEFVSLTPPQGLTCSSYLDPFINVAGGYLTNGDATNHCEYCPYRTTNEFLSNSFSIEYSHRWRDIGVFVAFIGFNVSSIFFGFCWTVLTVRLGIDRCDVCPHVHLPHPHGQPLRVAQGSVRRT